MKPDNEGEEARTAGYEVVGEKEGEGGESGEGVEEGGERGEEEEEVRNPCNQWYPT